MDGTRFDNLTKQLACRFSRRAALRNAGFAVASSAFVAQRAEAQGDLTTCTFNVQLQISVGDSSLDAGAVTNGELKISFDDEGRIAEGSFNPDEGEPWTGTGTVNGLGFDLVLPTGRGKAMAFTGVADKAILTCDGGFSGLVSGPDPGYIGTWLGETGESAGNGSSSTATSSSQPGQPAQPGQEGCAAGQEQCGELCCQPGATCVNEADGTCLCAGGTVLCQGQCIPGCPVNTLLNADTCECDQCAAEGQTCQEHDGCCSGYCGGGTCFVCNGIVCGDFGCVDPTRDQQNCGDCFNTCIAPDVCIEGECGCRLNQSSCTLHSECCSKLCFVSTCIDCSEVNNGTLTMCGEGACVDLKDSIDHCGTCNNFCPRTSGAIACCDGVCADLNADSAHCSTCDTACAQGQICYLGDCIAA